MALKKKQSIFCHPFTGMQQDTYIAHNSFTEQLVAIKANDEQTLQKIYLENYHKTEKYVLENQGTVAEAKDIFQEAFIAAWRNIKLDKFHPENESSLAGYLYTIAKYKWLDFLRSAHYRKTVSMDNVSARVEESTQHVDLNEDDQQYLQQVRAHFAQLGANCREVLTRYYYKKESLRAISSALNWTEATARNNKYRCLQQLRSMIKNK